VAGVAGVELGQNGCRDSLQHLLREDSEKLPSNVKRLKDSAVLIVALCNEVLLKLAKELEIKQVVRCQSFLTNNCLHSLDILANGIAGIQLVGHIRVVLPGHTLPNSGLHQPGQ